MWNQVEPSAEPSDIATPILQKLHFRPPPCLLFIILNKEQGGQRWGPSRRPRARPLFSIIRGALLRRLVCLSLWGLRPRAQVPKRPSAQVPQRPSVQVPKCPSAQVPKCPSAQVPKCPRAQGPKCPSAQAPKRPSAQAPRPPAQPSTYLPVGRAKL